MGMFDFFQDFGGDIIGTVADLWAGDQNRKAQNKANEQNAATQDYYATHGIQMRVKDAEAAGIHPLAALGAQTYNANPVVVGDTSWGDSLSRAGQNISRAVNATSTNSKRRESLALENGALQNELLKAQITQIHRATNPAFPGSKLSIDGQGQTPARERSTIPDVGFVETEQGGLAPIYSDAVKQRVEDSFLPEMEWYARNRLNPWAVVKGTGKPPRKGWWWSIPHQQWLPPEKTTYAHEAYKWMGGDD